MAASPVDTSLEQRSGTGMSQQQRVTSASSTVSSSQRISRIEKEISAGQRSFFSGIAFPTVCVKKIPSYMLRVSKYSTNQFMDSIVLTCFVDLTLDPPRPLMATETPSSCVSSLNSPLMRPTSGVTMLGPVEGLGNSRPMSRDANQRLVSFRVDDQKSPPKHLLTNFQNPFRPSDEFKHSTTSRTSSANNDVFDFIPAHQPRGPYSVRVPLQATVSEARVIVQQALRKIQQQELREIRESDNHTTLFGFEVDVEKASAISSPKAHSAPVKKKSGGAVVLNSLNAKTVSLSSLATLGKEIPDPTLDNSSAAAAAQRLALRPCDPLGRPVDLLTATSTTSVVQPFTASRPILSCFAKGTTSLLVCLAADPDCFRERIRALKMAQLEASERAAVELNKVRQKAVERIEEYDRAKEDTLYQKSLACDKHLRTVVLQPKKSEALKAFTTGEVRDEKIRKKEAADEAHKLSMLHHKQDTQERWARYFAAIKKIQRDADDSHEIFVIEETSLRAALKKTFQETRAMLAKAERCVQLGHAVADKVERNRLAHNAFANWAL